MANQDIMKVKIKRNDNVMVTAGKDRGKVLRVDTRSMDAETRLAS